MKFELLTVTDHSNKSLVSLPLGQVVALGRGRWNNVGAITTTAGGTVETVEPYEDLVSMWRDLTGTGE